MTNIVAHAESWEIIEPTWWTGTPALDADSYVVDCSPFDTAAELVDGSDLAVTARATYHDRGLVHFVNTGLTDYGDMRRLARLVLDAEMDYQGGANNRGRLQPNVFEIGAPLTAWLHYHHEMAYVGESPTALAFLAGKVAPGKGATFVADNLRATEAILATELGRKLRDLGISYHRDLTDREAYEGRDQAGVYNHWQQSFGTDDPSLAEERAQAKGLVTEWDDDRLLRTRHDASAFEYFPQLDRNVLFSSVADHWMWFDAWPNVSHLAPHERPLRMTYGDGSELTHDELRDYVEIYDRFGTPIDWRVGDVAVVCNYRFAHGRPGIHLAPGEERELGVVLGATFERIGDLPERW
ncbi:MAG: TauD/TfdA family dioxygenase [Actinomycetota bacterium]